MFHSFCSSIGRMTFYFMKYLFRAILVFLCLQWQNSSFHLPFFPQDLPGALDDASVTEALELHKIKNRQWSIFKTSAIKGEGLFEGLDWYDQSYFVLLSLSLSSETDVCFLIGWATHLNLAVVKSLKMNWICLLVVEAQVGKKDVCLFAWPTDVFFSHSFQFYYYYWCNTLQNIWYDILYDILFKQKNHREGKQLTGLANFFFFFFFLFSFPPSFVIYPFWNILLTWYL